MGPTSTDELVCELCAQFYRLGWATGTGGGISIRDAEGIHVAPSGVQKERIAPEDVFLLDASSLVEPKITRAAKNARLCVSECTPLFFNAYRTRDAGAVLHSHSVWAVMAARLFAPEGGPGRFFVRGLDMQ